jgi:hypothetical protein
MYCFNMPNAYFWTGLEGVVLFKKFVKKAMHQFFQGEKSAKGKVPLFAFNWTGPDFQDARQYTRIPGNPYRLNDQLTPMTKP